MTLAWQQVVLFSAVALLLLVVLRSGVRARDKNLRKAIIELCDGPAPSASGASVAVRDASKRYDGTWALASATINIAPGSLVAVIGGNEAGKSTLLNIMSGAEKPTSGDVIVDECSVLESAATTRARVGVVSGRPLLYPTLTVSENLRYFAKLFNFSRAETNAAIAAALGQVSLFLDRNKQVRRLPHEQQQRVAIARAVLHRPGLLLLDEPYAEHDVAAALRLDELLLDLQRAGNTVVLTSDEYSFKRCFRIADRVLIMKDGRIMHDLDNMQTSQAEAELVYREFFEVEALVETAASQAPTDVRLWHGRAPNDPVLDLSNPTDFTDATVLS